MRLFQLLALALLATAARADTIFIEGQLDTALTFCDMEDDRCPALGSPSGLGGIIATNAWGEWEQTVSGDTSEFHRLDNPDMGIIVSPNFIWHWFNEFDGYSWTLGFAPDTFPGLNGTGVPIGGSLIRMMQYGRLEYEVTGGLVSMRYAPEPSSIMLLLSALALALLINRRSIG
jgi:hypothetical protein